MRKRTTVFLTAFLVAVAVPVCAADNTVVPDVKTAVRAADNIVVLYPADLTLSTEGKIRIYAHQPGGGPPTSVSVNGNPANPLDGDAFRTGEVLLNPGLNLVDVGGKTVRVFNLAGLKLGQFRLPTEKENAPLVFQAYRLHPALSDGCEGCHAVEGGKLKAKDQKEACYACHDDFGKGEGKRYVHTPVAAGECTACHEPHFSVRPKLRKQDKDCYECHDPFRAEGTVHRPVANAECVACHSPHAGTAPRQLLKFGNSLCLGCHGSPHSQHRSAEVKGSMTQIPPDFPVEKGELSCLGCHSPHQTPERRLFRKPQGDLCKMCHSV